MMSEWIKCSNEMPKKSDYSDYSKAVIVFRDSNKCQHVAVYDLEENKWFCFFSGWTITNITHWMPLPDAPK